MGVALTTITQGMHNSEKRDGDEAVRSEMLMTTLRSNLEIVRSQIAEAKAAKLTSPVKCYRLKKKADRLAIRIKEAEGQNVALRESAANQPVDAPAPELPKAP